MNIKILEAKTNSELKIFVTFPLKIYQDNAYYVPPIIADELKNFDKKSNPAFDFCEVKCFLAIKNDKVVGRVATIINQNDELINDRKVRFGWFDAIDDIEVFSALIEQVKKIAKEHQINKIEGPVGFTNLDKAGMLTFGFDEVATLIGLYNFEYYPKNLIKLGFKENLHWVEFKVKCPDVLQEKVLKFSELAIQRYKLKLINFGLHPKKFLLNYADKILSLLEETYKQLPSFVPFTERQKEFYKNKYFSVLSKDLILAIEDENGQLIAFSIVMYDYSKAFQKAKGKLFPFGWYHLLNATKNNNSVHFYLIGVKPEYQSKGITSIIWLEMFKIFKEKKITNLETNPQLIQNKAVQMLFKDYEPVLHKERKTFVLEDF